MSGFAKLVQREGILIRLDRHPRNSASKREDVVMYLSPNTPHWQPKTEQDLQTAIENGVVEEGHYLDLKREIAKTRSSNRELARDLAQFAIDGGTLVIGVDEHSDGTAPTLAPVDLDGLPERVEQISLTVPDPPLPVTCSPIPSVADPSRGYLLVSVPVSGTAPHMVDGVYYGRGDKTRRVLSDAEVLRLHHTRADTEATASELLREYIARDPVPTELRQQAHFFVVVAPVRPRREMLLDAVHGPEWHQAFTALRNSALHPSVTGRDSFVPSLSNTSSFGRRADGAALTYGLTDDRRLERLANNSARYVEDAFELELTEDGGIRLMTTRFSDAHGNGTGQRIFAVMAPVLTRQAIALAVAVSDHTGYTGPWVLGCAATGIAGLSASTNSLQVSCPPYPSELDLYQATTTASTAEMAQTPGALTNRIVGRLLRPLGQADALRSHLTDQPSAE